MIDPLRFSHLFSRVPDECPQEVVTIVDACMQRNARLRPDAAALADDMERIIFGSTLSGLCRLPLAMDGQHS